MSRPANSYLTLIQENTRGHRTKAQKISKKVVKVGFEWDCIESLKNCIKSEYKEFEEAVFQKFLLHRKYLLQPHPF